MPCGQEYVNDAVENAVAFDAVLAAQARTDAMEWGGVAEIESSGSGVREITKANRTLSSHGRQTLGFRQQLCRAHALATVATSQLECHRAHGSPLLKRC